MKNLTTRLFSVMLLGSPLMGAAQNPYQNNFIVCAFERQLCKPFMPLTNTPKELMEGDKSARLIKEVTGTVTNGVWAPDSIVYAYNSKRISHYEDHNALHQLKYDVATVYSFDVAKNRYELSERRLQAMNGKGQVISITSEDWDAGKWTKSERTLYTYDNKGQNETVTNELYKEGAWVGVYQIEYSYNGKGEVLEAKSATWNSAAKAYVPTELEVFTYSPKMVTYTMKLINGGENEYRDNVRYIYYLNDAGLEVAEVHQNFASNMWQNSDSTSIILNSRNLPKESFIYSWSHENWRQYGHYVYNQAGKQYTMKGEGWDASADGMKDAVKDMLTFNNGGQRTVFESYNLRTGELVTKARYYYEENKPTATSATYRTVARSTATSPAMVNSMSVLVYPVPANTSINIAMSFQDAGHVDCVMYDMNGKLLKEWGDDVSGDYSKEVSVADQPSGVYWLKVKSKGGEVMKKFTVGH